MGKIFLVYNDTVYTYDQLLLDLNNKEAGYSYLYVKDNHPYEVFLGIIHSLLFDYPLEILDGDFSEQEISELGVDINLLTTKVPKHEHLYFRNMDEVMRRIYKKDQWMLTLYTSGTTGRPKKIGHTFNTLTKNVKVHAKFEHCIWAFAYNPTHMAGIQVFFQAFLNQNPLVYMFGKSMSNIKILMETYQITHISATATFYRNILPYLQGTTYPTMERVTFGGEKFDLLLEEKIKHAFPNSKITNVYASTEAGSLFAAKSDVFEIRPEYKQFVKITEQRELCIHRSLLGQSHSLENEWFQTGDFVETIDETHFKFQSRQSDMINVGGYKVNPIEVENLLMQVPGIIDVVVKSKKNSVTGEMLVADVIKCEELDEKELKKEIKQFATTHLQAWKVPRIIKFVDELLITRTGKKVRK